MYTKRNIFNNEETKTISVRSIRQPPNRLHTPDPSHNSHLRHLLQTGKRGLYKIKSQKNGEAETAKYTVSRKDGKHRHKLKLTNIENRMDVNLNNQIHRGMVDSPFSLKQPKLKKLMHQTTRSCSINPVLKRGWNPSSQTSIVGLPNRIQSPIMSNTHKKQIKNEGKNDSLKFTNLPIKCKNKRRAKSLEDCENYDLIQMKEQTKGNTPNKMRIIIFEQKHTNVEGTESNVPSGGMGNSIINSQLPPKLKALVQHIPIARCSTTELESEKSVIDNFYQNRPKSAIGGTQRAWITLNGKSRGKNWFNADWSKIARVKRNNMFERVFQLEDVQAMFSPKESKKESTAHVVFKQNHILKPMEEMLKLYPLKAELFKRRYENRIFEETVPIGEDENDSRHILERAAGQPDKDYHVPSNTDIKHSERIVPPPFQKGAVKKKCEKINKDYYGTAFGEGIARNQTKPQTSLARTLLTLAESRSRPDDLRELPSDQDTLTFITKKIF